MNTVLLSSETLRMANNYIYALRRILNDGQEEKEDEALATTHQGRPFYLSLEGKRSAVKR